MITIARKENQTETINNSLVELFKQEWEIIEIETEFKNKEDEDNAWMERFGD